MNPKFETDIEKNISYIQNKSVFTEYYFKQKYNDKFNNAESKELKLQDIKVLSFDSFSEYKLDKYFK